MNKKLTHYIGLWLAATIFLVPTSLQAMTVQIEKPVTDIQVNDVVMLNVYLDTDDKEVNAIDGSIILKGDYEIKTVSIAGSIFDLWLDKPSFKDNKISFVGGSTAGVFGSRLKLFSIAVKPTSAGNLSFSGDNAEVFLNDGKGSKVVTEVIDKTIPVKLATAENKNELEQIILEDKTQPEDFVIQIGKDSRVFDGKYFASFNTTDSESGINRYEVIEKENGVVRSGNTYIIQDQTLSGNLTVKAVDNAGNVRVVTTNMKDALVVDNSINWFGVLVGVMLLLVIFYVRKFFANKK